MYPFAADEDLGFTAHHTLTDQLAQGGLVLLDAQPGSRKKRSNCLLLSERTSTLTFRSPTTPSARPKPVMERIIVSLEVVSGQR
jgi:hypothetical protein